MLKKFPFSISVDMISPDFLIIYDYPPPLCLVFISIIMTRYARSITSGDRNVWSCNKRTYHGLFDWANKSCALTFNTGRILNRGNEQMDEIDDRPLPSFINIIVKILPQF